MVQTFDISNLNYLKYQNLLLEISKVDDGGLQRYEIRKSGCGKDSFP